MALDYGAAVQLEVEVPRGRAQVTVVLLHAAEAEVLGQRVEQVVPQHAVLVRHVEERRVVGVEPHVRAVLLRGRLVSSRRPLERLRAQTFALKISLVRLPGGNAAQGVWMRTHPQT